MASLSKNSTQTFRNQLLIHKALNPKKKIKQKKPIAQRFPSAKERLYFKFIQSIMAKYTEYTNTVIIPRIQNWQKELQRLDSVSEDIVTIIQGFDDLYELIFETNRELLEKTLEGFGYDLNTLSDEQFKRIIENAVGVNPVTDNLWVNEKVKLFTQNNVNLISGLGDEYKKKINLTLIQGLQSGVTSQKLTADLLKINEQFSESRARLIARDQIGKFWGDVNKKRQLDIGAEYYIWRTMKDERVRESHEYMDGLLCDWNDPSTYSEDDGKNWSSRSGINGVELHPGEDYQCRCYAEIYTKNILQELFDD
jgi:SPP1 gp7 family putative phage head morphogenesis protein